MWLLPISQRLEAALACNFEKALGMNAVGTLQQLKERFEYANNLIVTHSSFNDEARNVAAYHSVLHMINLTEVIKNCDGQLTKEAMPVVNAVNVFLDSIEKHCDELAH